MRSTDLDNPRRTYLDWNASAPLSAAARAAMLDALGNVGNASSIHAEGRRARRLIEDARAALAAAAGLRGGTATFTSGATEAANLALGPVWRKGKGELRFGRLFVSAIEHPCVLAGGRFAVNTVERFAVRADGTADLDDLAARLARRDGGLPLVALMAVNNETGVIQPVAQAAELAHAHGGSLLVDAVQAAGRIPLDMVASGADFLILSSHKIGGPQGAGALLIADEGLSPTPLLTGGGQEARRRAGTENVAAIAGFGAAAAEIPVRLGDIARQRELRDWMEGQLRTISGQLGIAPPVVFGAAGSRVGNTGCFGVAGIAAETALIGLDLAGIAVSSGSACSSGKVARSHVLAAMGVDDAAAATALRIGIGPDTTRDDIGRFLAAWTDIAGRIGAKAVA
jgi:cysteine desulfurase